MVFPVNDTFCSTSEFRNEFGESFDLKIRFLFVRLSIYNAETVHRTLVPHQHDDKLVEYSRHIDLNVGNGFSFTRFSDISPQEFEKFSVDGLIFM